MDISKLKGIIPEIVFVELTQILKTRVISSNQLAAFLAQCSYESAGFTRVVENLNYSADGLLKTFGNRFVGVADKYARKPELIANRAYAHKGGNGNEASGDGWKYRGMGYLQMTLKNNFVGFDASVVDDITSNPDLVMTKYPLTSAFWFFDVNKLWAITDFETLTGKINSAKLGLDKRKALYNKFLSVL